MKSKLLSLFLLTAVLSLAMVSAATSFPVSTLNFVSPSLSESFTLIPAVDNSNYTFVINYPRYDDGTNILLNSIGNQTNLSGDVTATIPVTASSVDYSKLKLGKVTYPGSVFVQNINDPEDNKTITINFLNTFCKDGELTESTDNRKLIIDYIKDRSSEDDWEWKPLDEVEIEVKVKFESDDSKDDIDAILKIALYDDEGREVDLEEVNDDEDLEKEISLDEGDYVKETFVIKIPVEDIEDGNYRLFIKAYEDGEEDSICTSMVDDGASSLEDKYSQPVDIRKESYDVVLKDLYVTTPAPCGGEIEITGKIYNIGSHDEDRTLIRVYNKELGIDYTSRIFELDEGDSEKFSFTFRIPADAQEKSYSLRLWTEFKYSKSSEAYREQSEDYVLVLKAEGECKSTETKNAVITAELDPETPKAVAGKQVIIRATIKNTGTVETTYTISVLGNSGWSSLNTIDPKIITLAPGESEEVSIFLDIDKDAAGEKEFTIKASYDGYVKEQKVALLIEKGVTQYEVVNHLKENWLIYAIAIVNIILIIAIIAVIKSMASRPSVR